MDIFEKLNTKSITIQEKCDQYIVPYSLIKLKSTAYDFLNKIVLDMNSTIISEQVRTIFLSRGICHTEAGA